MFFFRDQSIPTLESILSNNEVAFEETNKISQLIARQTTMEANLAAAQSSQTPEECTPPPVCHDFQTSRLFLSHFGLLSLDEGIVEVTKQLQICQILFTLKIIIAEFQTDSVG